MTRRLAVQLLFCGINIGLLLVNVAAGRTGLAVANIVLILLFAGLAYYTATRTV
jgi:hypothetical protein